MKWTDAFTARSGEHDDLVLAGGAGGVALAVATSAIPLIWSASPPAPDVGGTPAERLSLMLWTAPTQRHRDVPKLWFR